MNGTVRYLIDVGVPGIEHFVEIILNSVRLGDDGKKDDAYHDVAGDIQ